MTGTYWLLLPLLQSMGGSGAVKVKLARRTQQIAGVPGRPDPRQGLGYARGRSVRGGRGTLRGHRGWGGLCRPGAAALAAAAVSVRRPCWSPLALLPPPPFAYTTIFFIQATDPPPPPAPSHAPRRPTVQYKEVWLQREVVNISPVYYTSWPQPLAAAAAQPAAATNGNGATSPVTAAAGAAALGMLPGAAAPGAAANGTDGAGATPQVGYIRLTNFSGNAAEEVAGAISQLEASGSVSSYILDLRDNPGGLVRAGIEVASLWLDGAPTVFSITGRAGAVLRQTTEAPAGHRALTHAPLAVLVNERSASASEILSGALRDNKRALIVGDAHTYGKGKIQSVYQLADGSGKRRFRYHTISLYQCVAYHHEHHDHHLLLGAFATSCRCPGCKAATNVALTLVVVCLPLPPCSPTTDLPNSPTPPRRCRPLYYGGQVPDAIRHGHRPAGHHPRQSLHAAHQFHASICAPRGQSPGQQRPCYRRCDRRSRQRQRRRRRLSAWPAGGRSRRGGAALRRAARQLRPGGRGAAVL